MKTELSRIDDNDGITWWVNPATVEIVYRDRIDNDLTNVMLSSGKTLQLNLDINCVLYNLTNGGIEQ